MKDKLIKIIPKLVILIILTISIFITILVTPILLDERLYIHQHFLISKENTLLFSFIVTLLYLTLLVLSYLVVHNIGNNKLFGKENQIILKWMFYIATVVSILLTVPIVISMFIVIYGPPMVYALIILIEIIAITISCITYIFSSIISEAHELQMINELTI